MSTPEEIEQRVADQMESLGVEFEMFEIDPDFADTAAFCEKYGFPMEKSGNTIVVASKRGQKKHCDLHRRGDGPAGREQAGQGTDGGVAGVVRGGG